LPTGQRLPELPESQATGRTLQLYEEIKEWSGVPMVALIYRHLATLPGVLDWACDVLRPVMTSGLLQERAGELVHKVELPQIPTIPPDAREAAGVTADEEEMIRSSLAAYNRSNPVNIIALRCIEQHLAQAATAAGAGLTRPWTPPERLPAPPPMLDPDAMQPHVRRIISWLVHRGQGRYSDIWPSLYRHLARVPKYLAFAAVVLPPYFAGIDRATRDLSRVVDRVVDELVGGSSVSPTRRPPAELLDGIRQAMTSFTMLIPEMAVVGTLLERATPPRTP
jgi:hypothetical protein